MRQLQADGAEGLGGEAQGEGERLALLRTVLGIPQDGETHVGAVNPELMGAAGDGTQLKFT